MRIILDGGPFDGRAHDVDPDDRVLELPHLLMHGDGTAPDLAGIVTYRRDNSGVWRWRA